MTNKETLSDKAKQVSVDFPVSKKQFVYKEQDVRGFIQDEWDLFMSFLDNDISFLELVNERNKLAGDKLTK